MKSRAMGCWLGAAATVLSAGIAQAQERPKWVDPHANVAADEVVGNGYRRVYRTEVEQVSPEQLALMISEGKDFEIDPATGGIIRQTFTDYLPKGWLMEAPADGSRVDSFGDPIVNDAQGLPAWSQRSVDALRAEIARASAIVADRRANGGETQEVEAWLGNLVGQALTRDINIDAVLNIDTSHLMNGVVAREVVSYLHFYENLRYTNQTAMGYVYAPTQYTGRVSAFVAAQGSSLADVQVIDVAPVGDRGTLCYNTTAFARGMTSLVTPTIIWNASNTDDAASDIPTGFGLFSFQDCEDADNNDSVRVSTNGYLTFFQQGGGALNGTTFTNDVIPDATQTPDGWVGTFWDDLHVQPAQGEADVVSYLTEGAVGSRVLTVEYRSMSHHGAGTTEFYWFQMKLYETSSVVQLHFFDIGGWANSGDESATIGMEDFDGTEGNCGPNCGNANTDRAPNNYSFEYFRPFYDNCVSAFNVVDGDSFTDLSLRRFSNDGANGCGFSTQNRDAWFTFLAPCAGDLVVSACGSYDSGGVDTVLSAHTACPGTLANQVVCNDQFGGTGCSGNDSQITVAMTDGQRVYIRASHYNVTPEWFQNGTYDISFNFNETGAAPANDNANNAITVVNGSVFIDDLGCATNDGATNCGFTAGNADVWYTFQADCDGTLTLNTDGTSALSGVDTVVSAHSDIPGTSGNTVGCDDDGGTGLDSNLVLAMAGGQRVWIRVANYGSSIGDGRFNMNVTYVNTPGPAPANDTCAGAIPLACNASILGSSCNATNDPAGLSGPCGLVVTAGVWYRVVGDGNSFAVSTCGAETTFDTLIHVFSGACGSLTPVACNDDSVCAFDSNSSRVSFATTPGVLYYITVCPFFFGDPGGQFRLTISNGGRPFNDDCSAAALATAGGSYNGNLWCATPDGNASCGGTAGNRSAWFRFTAPADGTFTVDTCGSRNTGGADQGADTVIAAFAGSCAGAQVACSDDGGIAGCSIRDSRISGVMSAGQTVLVRVTHFGVPDQLVWIGNGSYTINFNFAGCDSVDFNGDGLFPDIQDITDFINVFGGGFCAPPNPPACNSDIDFNNDGLFPDVDDITALINTFGGAPCP